MRRIIQRKSFRPYHMIPISNYTRLLPTAAPTSSKIETPSPRASVAINKPGSSRHLSTRLHKHCSPSNPFLNPFPVVGRVRFVDKSENIDVDGAFMGLLKAMSALKTSPDGSDQKMLDLLNHDIKGVSSLNNGEVGGENEKKDAGRTEQKIETQTAAKKSKRKIPLQQQIQNAMAAKQVDEVLDLLKESMVSPNNNLNDGILGRVIRFLSYRDLRASFETLKYLVQRCRDQGKIVKLPYYSSVIHGIFHANYLKGYEVRDLAEEMYNHMKDSFPTGSTSVIYQHILMPILVSQLARHRDLRVVQSAKPMVEFMIAEQHPVLNPELYETILKEASPRRVGQLYLPYHQLLSELVSRGYKPSPSTVQNVLQSYQPFEDSRATYEVLRAIKTLAQDSSDYRVDLGTLESVSMTTKLSRHTELNMLIWDLAELFHYEPTECMFEDVVLSFGGALQDKNAIKALLDMERCRYTPSYAFLRHYALMLSYSNKRMSFAKNIVMYNEDDQYLSASAMNCLLLGFGMRKDLDGAFQMFESFAKFNLERDENTFVFLMESLCLNVKDQVVNEDDADDVLAIVETVLDSMKLAGVDISSKFLYEHVRILCILKQVDDARQLIEKAVVDRIPVKPGAIVMVANEYLDRGDIENAQAMAKLSVNAGCGEPANFLKNRIQEARDTA